MRSRALTLAPPSVAPTYQIGDVVEDQDAPHAVLGRICRSLGRGLYCVRMKITCQRLSAAIFQKSTQTVSWSCDPACSARCDPG